MPDTKLTTTDRDTPPEQPAYRLDDQPGFLLRVALQRHTTLFMNKMVENLTPPQFSTLAKLREVGQCSQNHLGRLIHYDSATIAGVIERLRARELIVSTPDPLDGRRRTISLTERGRRVADEAIVAVSAISKETFSSLSAAERRTLTSLLQRVSASDGEGSDSERAGNGKRDLLNRTRVASH